MKRLLLSLVVASGFFTAVTATAQMAPWLSINQRQKLLEDRIEQGIRAGVLTRAEAIVLRGEFQTLERLEAQYRRSGDGLIEKERRDLDQRFERLRLKVRSERRDAEERRGARWMPINERQAEIFTKIDQGVRRGGLTRAEAIRLRGEFATLVQLEAEYRRSRGVFTMEERMDLDQRLDRLSRRVLAERLDGQTRY